MKFKQSLKILTAISVLTMATNALAQESKHSSAVQSKIKKQSDSLPISYLPNESIFEIQEDLELNRGDTFFKGLVFSAKDGLEAFVTLVNKELKKKKSAKYCKMYSFSGYSDESYLATRGSQFILDDKSISTKTKLVKDLEDFNVYVNYGDLISTETIYMNFHLSGHSEISGTVECVSVSISKDNAEQLAKNSVTIKDVKDTFSRYLKVLSPAKGEKASQDLPTSQVELLPDELLKNAAPSDSALN